MAPPRYAPTWQGGPSSSTGSNPGPATRRSSTRAGDAGKGDASVAEPEEIENFEPPEWRTVLNNRADLGYPDFYPSRPGYGQSEDVLTEENVKNGYVAKSFVAVGAESFSMHGPIYQHLLGGGLELLMKLGQEVLEKRDEAMPQFGERAFRIPPRVTYNETKRLQFLADLANPNIPLHRLMRDRVPHGFKGVELLDTMFSPPPPPHNPANKAAGASGSTGPIPVSRALWFIRVLGANEITAHRSRVQAAPVTNAVAAAASPMAATPTSNPGVAPTSVVPTIPLSSNDWYTQEFTIMFTSWLRIQLNQLILPQPTGSNAKLLPKVTVPPTKAPAGVLGDEKSRAKWLAKWDYSTSLLQELYAHRLVSTRLLVAWLADTLQSANLAQLGFIGQLCGTYLNDMLHHTSTGRRFIRGACEKIHEVGLAHFCAKCMELMHQLRDSPGAATLAKVEAILAHLIRSLFRGNPDILISPHTWNPHHQLLKDVCGSDGLETILAEVERRNEALVFRPAASATTASPRRNHIAEIAKLDSISYETNMNELCRSFFDGSSSPTTPALDLVKLEDKVFLLLNWAMGLRHLGIHRPYGCHTMLRLWTEQRAEYLSRSAKSRPVDIFPQLYNWLDTAPAARKQRNIQAIGITFGEFTRQGMFSYSRYLQTLIARGHTTRARPNGPRSHHMDILRSIPIFVEAQDLLQQRRIALSGDDHEAQRKADEEEVQAMDAFKADCKEYVPELYGFKRYGRSPVYKEEVDHAMPSTEEITRFIFLQARFELYAEAEKRLKRQGKIPAMNASTFARVIHILHLCKGYSSIADFIVRGIRLNDNLEILRITIDTLRRHADVWTAMDRWSRIVDALMERFHKLDRKDIYHPRLPKLLLDLAAVGRVKEEEIEDIQGYIDDHEKVSSLECVMIDRQDWADNLPTSSDAKPSMPALRRAIVAGDIGAATQLGQDLYDRHGPHAGWADTWWSTIVDALKNQSIVNDSTFNSLQAAGAHADRICTFLAFTIDVVVARWLDSLAPIARMEMLSAVSPIRQLFLILVTRRRLSTPMLLDRLCYGVWKQLSSIALQPHSRISTIQFQAIDSTVILCQQLLLTKPPNSAIPPLDHQESLIAQTSRAEAFNNRNIQDLIRHLPFLVILGSSSAIPEKTRAQIKLFFSDFATIPEFKTAAFRHLALLKDSFLSSEMTKPGMDPAIESGMIETLKAIMSDGPSEKATLPSLESGSSLSAWRWTSVILEMRVEFKRLALRIDGNENATEARATLHQLVADSLNRDASADDADLLRETFRGIESVVTLEVLACGMDRLAGILAEIDAENGIEEADRKVNQVLRIVDAAGKPDGPISHPGLLVARGQLIEQLALILTNIEGSLSDETVDNDTSADPGEALELCLKVLRFVLAIAVPDIPTPSLAKSDIIQLIGPLFRTIIALHDLGHSALQPLHDMLVYVVDTAPSSSRTSIHSVLLAEGIAIASSAPAISRTPLIGALLPYQSPHRRHMALATGSPDIVSEKIHLDDRPWELFEYLAPIPGRRSHEDQFLASRPLRDNASLPMSLFNARAKRDAAPGREPPKDHSEISDTELDPDWHDYASERNLGDGLAGEPIAAKQSATLLYAGPDDLPGEELGDAAAARAAETMDLTASSSLSNLPQFDRPRRMSMRIASNARIQAGTNNDPISIDHDDEDETSEDSDEREEAPSPKRQRVGSKTSISSQGGQRATMGGKAPARKTVGGKTLSGKNVGRKAMGGKSVRGMGGKALKGVRR